MKYIDAEALSSILRAKSDMAIGTPKTVFASVEKIIDLLPGIVMCGECRYYQDNNGGYPHEECKWNKDETPDPDDYCSGGERIET